MTKRLILDSGAFGVWNKGKTIDLGEYVAFCAAHPWVTYFVNLDVIPGVARKKSSITPEAVERSCQAGWDNYQQIIKELPEEKVIPVYHQNDDIRWLTRYLDAGVKYLGISPANDSTTAGKIKWMTRLRRHLFDGAGRPVVKTHGFAVTSFDLMKFWEWHSVDSASWKLNAGWGTMYVPRKMQGKWNFAVSPMSVGVSPMSPTRQKAQAHITTMTPAVKDQLMEYLDLIDMKVGTWSFEVVANWYKLQGEEVWFNRKQHKILRPIEKGVGTSFEMRAAANIKLMRMIEKHVPVKHIYLAGAPMPYPCETKCVNRLLCYPDVKRKGGAGSGHFDRHKVSMEKTR